VRVSQVLVILNSFLKPDKLPTCYCSWGSVSETQTREALARMLMEIYIFALSSVYLPRIYNLRFPSTSASGILQKAVMDARSSQSVEVYWLYFFDFFFFSSSLAFTLT